MHVKPRLLLAVVRSTLALTSRSQAVADADPQRSCRSSCCLAQGCMGASSPYALQIAVPRVERIAVCLTSSPVDSAGPQIRRRPRGRTRGELIAIDTLALHIYINVVAQTCTLHAVPCPCSPVYPPQPRERRAIRHAGRGRA